MKKLLLLPITIPLGMMRGAVEGAMKTAADALVELAGVAGGDRDVESYEAPAPASPMPTAVRAQPAAEPEAEATPPGPPAEVVDLDDVRAPAAPPVAPDPQQVAEDLGLQEGRTEEQPDTLVESEGSADPGAEIHVDEPWPGYGMLKAADVVDRLSASDAATKAIVRLYEQQHRNRRSVLAATES